MADGRSTARLARVERQLADLQQLAREVDSMVEVTYEDEYRNFTVDGYYGMRFESSDYAQVHSFLQGMLQGMRLANFYHYD